MPDNYEEIYKNWESYRYVKTHIVFGESMWARELPDGAIGLDNNPLDDDYRWQDIYRAGLLIHRRWQTKIWYEYEDLEVKEESEGRRSELYETLKSVGKPNFFWSGRAYVLFESDNVEDCRNKLVEALKGVGFEYSVEPLWRIRGEDPPEEVEDVG